MSEVDEVAETINLLKQAKNKLLKYKQYERECNELENLQEKLTSELEELCG